jgi:hypothetical protein
VHRLAVVLAVAPAAAALLVATAIVHCPHTVQTVAHMQELYPSRDRHVIRRHHHAVLSVVALTATTARSCRILILTGMLVTGCTFFLLK